MSKPKAAPVGDRTRAGKHAKVVENQDFSDFVCLMGAEPRNRKERRAKEKQNDCTYGPNQLK